MLWGNIIGVSLILVQYFTHVIPLDASMYYVSYDEVQSFISRLNRLTGKTFALPTEAQWEYAAKGGAKGTSYKFSGDTSVARVAWFMGNSKKTTAERQILK